jgi:hypothetical protein
MHMQLQCCRHPAQIESKSMRPTYVCAWSHSQYQLGPQQMLDTGTNTNLYRILLGAQEE